MKKYNKILNAIHLLFLATFSAIMLTTPVSVSAVALQPPGQIPITEPLRPTPEGVEPNYSNNIQDDSQTPANEVSAQAIEEESVANEPSERGDTPALINSENAEQNSPTKNSSKKWLWGFGVIILLGLLGGGVYLLRRAKRTNATLAIAALMISATSVLFLSDTGQAQAQNTKNTGISVQRVIEEEGSNGLTQSQIKAGSETDSQSGRQVIFGLAGILLIVVAVGAAAIFWRGSTTETPQKE